MTLDELDRLAAEKVMGFSGIAQGAQYWWNSEHEIAYCRKEAYDDDFKVWQPTRNISQAWECLEKLKSTFTITKLRDLNVSCLILEPTMAKEIAPTAPEAIVRACLKAKGVDL